MRPQYALKKKKKPGSYPYSTGEETGEEAVMADTRLGLQTLLRIQSEVTELSPKPELHFLQPKVIDAALRPVPLSYTRVLASGLHLGS